MGFPVRADLDAVDELSEQVLDHGRFAFVEGVSHSVDGVAEQSHLRGLGGGQAQLIG